MLEGIQLWVNLPRAFKMSSPRYQTLINGDIPAIELTEGAGRLRVIAGEFRGRRGPAKTFSPIHLYDVFLKAGQEVELALPERFNTSAFVLHGRVVINGAQAARAAELALFGHKGERLMLTADEEATILVLSGEPIGEPIARYGPFVMNTQAELVQAVEDYRAGRMGHLS
jgi:redox-sensitive bicupin YhaK (pirin superfamily)